jgi:hypothetical protein
MSAAVLAESYKKQAVKQSRLNLQTARAAFHYCPDTGNLYGSNLCVNEFSQETVPEI